ncbi:MAG: ABC transporter ATP-binding protein [Sporomusaceae bacterium]|nr:ABC transporter ATP-binding protein [Sporomusaceae bacterium]
MSVSIDIEQVVKKFGNDTIISGLSLHIEPGEFFTLLGPSGCGKTTLLRMIIGFNSIEGGLIKVGGQVVNDIAANQRNMGMVFQNYAIFPHMSVKDNVAFGLRMRKLTEAEVERQVDEILRVVKIDHLKDRMPVKLSGGQQQRVALARAIVIHPQVLLMDEPLSNLDAKLRVEMRNAIKQIQRQVHITTVYVTHDQEEALAVSDRIAVMNNGLIQQIGTPKTIYQRPANTFVASFIGLSNLMKAKLEKTAAGAAVCFENGYRVPMHNVAAAAADGQPLLVSVRPEEFCLQSIGEGLTGRIVSSVFIGLNTHYFVRLADGQEVEVIHDAADILADGTPVLLTVKADKINIFDAESRNTLIKGEGQ